MTPRELDAIRDKWLAPCGGCDAGIGSCTHPQDDYRPVIVALVAEVERLRQLCDDHREIIEAQSAEVERLRGIVGDDDPRHIIEFRDRSWTIKHPNSCDPDLFGCVVNRAAERDLVEAPEVLGRFYCDIRDGRFVVTDIAARPAAEDGTRDG